MTQRAYFQAESALHRAVVEYLSLKYPTVLKRTDFAAGTKLTWPQIALMKQLQNNAGWPDLFIYAARGEYHGLALELKAATPYLKDGSLSTKPHIQQQEATLAELRAAGYKAEFAYGFDAARAIIDGYFNEQKNDDLPF